MPATTETIRAFSQAVTEIREKLVQDFPFLNTNIGTHFGLDGLQFDGKPAATFLNKNPKGVSMRDLQFLAAVVAHLNPTHIVETGTYTGFSCLTLAYLAKRLGQDLKITTIEVNPKLSEFAHMNAQKMKVDDQIQFVTGNTATELTKQLRQNPADMVFLDGDPFSLELYDAKTFCNVIVGHDIFHFGSTKINQRGADFMRVARYENWNSSVFQTGECGLGVLWR